VASRDARDRASDPGRVACAGPCGQVRGESPPRIGARRREGDLGVGLATLTRGRQVLDNPLRTYAGRAAVSLAVCAFLKAIRPLASWRSARWFSSFFDQRMRMPRLRFSQEWLASTTQRRARQPGVRIFSAISSPRARMCAVNSYPATRSRTSLLSYARSRQMPCGAPGVGFGRSTGIESIVSFRSL